MCAGAHYKPENREGLGERASETYLASLVSFTYPPVDGRLVTGERSFPHAQGGWEDDSLIIEPSREVRKNHIGFWGDISGLPATLSPSRGL